MWRTILHMATSQPNLLCIPMSYPIILRLLPSEDESSRALRQADHATLIAYADACTTNSGIGGFIPNVGWFSNNLKNMSSYIQHDGTTVPMDINVLEFIATLITAFSAVATLPSYNGKTNNRHIHIWTDNTSCKTWLTKFSAVHPLHCCLLQVFGFIQARHHCLITVGHIKGEINTFADAASRNFNCPNGQNLRQQLNLLPLLPSFSNFILALEDVALTPSFNISQLLTKSLMILDTTYVI